MSFKRKQKKKNGTKIRFFLIFLFLFEQNAYGAPPLRIVGSSTVFPFAATVGEHFSYKTQEPIPLIEAIGTGAGIKLFCSGLKGPDGVITSRPLTRKEGQKCRDNGITFQEFIIGQDGLVLVQNTKSRPLSLTLEDLARALSESIKQGTKCIKNPYKTWQQIQSTFPSYPIRVLGPAPTSGTYDILIEKIGDACGSLLRHDGQYIEAPANENLIVQKILNTTNTIGIITFSFYEQNKTALQAIPLNGVQPSFLTIQNKKYVLNRPLYLYIKTNNPNPGMRLYTLEFTSLEAVGEKGYLNKKGLIPLTPQEQKVMHEHAKKLR